MTNATVPPVKGYSMAGAASSPPALQKSENDLESMTRVELIKLATEYGLEVSASIRKPALIEMLEEAGF